MHVRIPIRSGDPHPRTRLASSWAHATTPTPGEPKCPPWLDAEGRKCWREIVRQLGKLGVLTHADRQALAVYCDTWSRWREASDFVRKHVAFLPVKDDSGKLKYLHQFPQVSIAQKLLTNLLRYQQEFGLTPSSRSGIETTGPREPDALDLFLAEHSSGLSPTWSGPSRDNAEDAAADRSESID